jgi:predicted ATP-grasp superfamily ATP-dependent carboligase
MLPSNRPVLALGTEPRIVLPIARSLHAHGIPVWVASIMGPAGLRSSAVRGVIRLPDPHSSDFIEHLIQSIEREGFDMLIPLSDSALVAVARWYDRLDARIHVACPSPDILNTVLDKGKTLEAAASIGIPIPLTYNILNFAQAAALQLQLRFPLIAKPRTKNTSSTFKVLYFADLQDLERAFRNNQRLGEEAIFNSTALALEWVLRF